MFRAMVLKSRSHLTWWQLSKAITLHIWSSRIFHHGEVNIKLFHHLSPTRNIPIRLF